MSLILVLVIFFISLTIHEYSHGWVAAKRGDMTAAYLGRLTLNPIAHIDPFGTVILPLSLLLLSKLTHAPLIIFGWAKPVPVNFSNLRNPKQDMVLVGLAGPLANILLAFVLGLVAVLLKDSGNFLLGLLQLTATINLFLAIFNLIPVPPLDGSRVLMGLLPYRWAYQYAQIEPYGFIIIVSLIYMGAINLFVMPLVNFFMNIFFRI